MEQDTFTVTYCMCASTSVPTCVCLGLWGFPFGRAPEANVFQSTFEHLEDNPIVSDPTNPPGKDLLVGE